MSDESRGRNTGLSQSKVPESNSRSTVTVKGQRKEKLCKFLAKTEDLAGHVVEEEEEEEEKQQEMKIPQQIKKNTTLPEQTHDSPDLKTSVIGKETTKRDRKWDLDSIQLQRVRLEASLKTSRSRIIKLDKTIAAKERHLNRLELIIERENNNYEDTLKSFEKEHKSNQRNNAAVEKLNEEIGIIKSELAKNEEILNKRRRYKNIVSMLSPPDAQDEQNREPQESAVQQGLERGLAPSPGRVLPSTREPTLSSAHDDTPITHSKLDCDSSEYEEKPELLFSDPQQLLGLMTELTEQNLSLIQNFHGVEETLKELRQTTETTVKKMKEDEEKLTLPINDMKDRIDKEKERTAQLKRRVQLHNSSKTKDQDVLLDALGVKVTEVHRCRVDGWLTNLSTLEKLSSIECRMYSLLELIESMPEESLETLRQIKDSERRSRLHEEKLKLEREKKKEMMKRCLQRSLGDIKKRSGRKLMPRCIPVEQKLKVSDEDNVPAEDELHTYLFREDVE